MKLADTIYQILAIETYAEEYQSPIHREQVKTKMRVIADKIANQLEAKVKPAKNVKDFDWLENKLETILFDMEDGNATKEQTKNKLYEIIFDDLVSEIQKLRDSSLSV